VKPPTPINLVYFGRKTPVYPVRQFTKAECATYVWAHWRGHKVEVPFGIDLEPPQKLRRGRRKPLEARRLYAGLWVYLGAGRPYTDRWKLIPYRKRKPRRVPPSFLGAGLVARGWKPDVIHYFGDWEQYRYVHWTRLPIPTMAHLLDFLTMKPIPPHRVGDTHRKDADYGC
jgi:hypothetical protein